MKRILFLLLSSLISKGHCQAAPTGYDINASKIAYLADHRFVSPTFDLEMNFIPDIKAEVNFYRNFFEGSILNGKIKRATRSTKTSVRNYKAFKETTLYDQEGYKIETKYEDGLTKYFYDEKRNVTKEISFSGADTTQITEINYNEQKQIVSFTKKRPAKKDERYNLSVTIAYNEKGYPVALKNSHPIKEYSFIKSISYDGNIVTETEFSNDKKVDERIYWFSKDNKVVKYQHNASYTVLSEYNSKKEIIKELTYENDEFAYLNTYLFNDKGDIIRSAFSNNPDEYEEVSNYEIRYDDLHNKISSRQTNNLSDKFTEEHYEYEYF